MFYFGELTGALEALGEHERELTEARRARALYPDLAVIRAMEASALAAFGRFDDLETLTRESLDQPLRWGGPTGS